MKECYQTVYPSGITSEEVILGVKQIVHRTVVRPLETRFWGTGGASPTLVWEIIRGVE